MPSDIFTNQLVVKITNVDPELEPPDQNLRFGDDLFVMGVDAPTSFAVHRIQDPTGSGGVFINADSTFTIDNPQTGLVRIALQGDWTNAGRVSARLTIERERSLPTLPSAIGRIRQDDLVPYTIDVPAGVTEGVIELFWLQNWGRYPTNDLDMLIMDPAGHLVVDGNGNPRGATLDSPERVVLTNPAPGTWTVLVNGFTIWPQGRSGHHPGKDTVHADGDGGRPSTEDQEISRRGGRLELTSRPLRITTALPIVPESADPDRLNRLVAGLVSCANRNRKPAFPVVIIVVVPASSHSDKHVMGVQDSPPSIIGVAARDLQLGRHGAAVVARDVVDRDELDPVRLRLLVHGDTGDGWRRLVGDRDERGRRGRRAVAVGTGQRHQVLAEAERSGRPTASVSESPLSGSYEPLSMSAA